MNYTSLHSYNEHDIFIAFLIDEMQIIPDRVICCTGDNCSTNTGSKGGVFVQLKVIFASLFSLGCFAHKLALMIAAALLLLGYFVALQIIIKRLIKWARSGHIKVAEIARTAKKVEENAKKITILHRIRWLAQESVMKAIYSSKLSIMIILKKEYDNDGADALWLYPKLSTIHFWLLFVVFLDVIVLIGYLSRYFQGD